MHITYAPARLPVLWRTLIFLSRLVVQVTPRYGENVSGVIIRQHLFNVSFRLVGSEMCIRDRLSPTHSPLPIVTLFLTSMSLVIFCFLFSSIDYVPVKGEIIWYLSFTTWLISLSIMLSPVPSMLSWRVGAPSFFLLQSIPLCKCTTVFWPTHLLMGT